MSETVGQATEHDAQALNALLAKMPAVERVIASADAQPLIAQYGRTQVVDAIRAAQDAWRRDVQAGTFAHENKDIEPFALERVIAATAQRLADRAQSRLRPVFNLTGTVLHT